MDLETERFIHRQTIVPRLAPYNEIPFNGFRQVKRIPFFSRSGKPCERIVCCEGFSTINVKRVKSRPVANGIKGFTGGMATGYHVHAGVNRRKFFPMKAPDDPSGKNDPRETCPRTPCPANAGRNNDRLPYPRISIARTRYLLPPRPGRSTRIVDTAGTANPRRPTEPTSPVIQD